MDNNITKNIETDNNNNIDFKNTEFSTWNYESVIYFLKNNYIQIGMFFLVFIIIYVVDYVSNINAAIYGLPSAIPGLPPGHNNNNNKNTKVKPVKKIKNKK
jgi:hypothetical protein